MVARIGSLLLVVCVVANVSFAGWDKVLSTRDSAWIGRTLEIRSGHFFDELNGLVGAGSSTDIPLIFTTSDGGASWGLAITPINGNGVVSSFFFRDRLSGFATVHKSSFPSSSIWRTSDGGATWIDITGSRTAFEHTCIYQTSKALIVTSWDRTGGKGGFSTDGGITWNEVFANAADHSSNGIGFVDDLHGLVTMGPASLQPSGNNAYTTSDGGLTWKKVQQFNEAWSVYALKGTSTFFLAPEGDIAGSTGDRDIYRSNDYGQTFLPIHQFPSGIQLAGHIDGKNATLYLQTRIHSNVKGLFRSDDLGATWKNIGGPSNIEDSRFVVTGCAGQIVYAFDNIGNIWKTSDGGDGTLIAQSSPNVTLSEDTLLLASLYCDPIAASSLLHNTSCDTMIVDSLTIVNDTLGEFTLSSTPPVRLDPQGAETITVTFTPVASGLRQVKIRLTGTKGSYSFDTTIIVLAENRLAPELVIPAPLSRKAGEDLILPVYIKPTSEPFTFTQYSMRLSYDGDILEPASAVIAGTLSEGGSVQVAKDGEDGMIITGSLTTPVTQTSDLTKPLVNIAMKTFLSQAMATSITIDSFGIPLLLPRCGEELLRTTFTIDPQCGDSILSSFMRTNSLAEISSAVPNPSASGRFVVTIRASDPHLASLVVLDVSGQVVAEPLRSMLHGAGSFSHEVNLADLAAGSYYLCLRDGLTVQAMYPIRIIK